MYRAHTTCAQLLVSVLLSPPSLFGHNSQRLKINGLYEEQLLLNAIEIIRYYKPIHLKSKLTTLAARSCDSHFRQNQGPVGTETIP